jgi:hypothetical protein
MYAALHASVKPRFRVNEGVFISDIGCLPACICGNGKSVISHPATEHCVIVTIVAWAFRRMYEASCANRWLPHEHHAEHCLLYGRPLDEGGLTWRQLVAWWARSDMGARY